jgi:hypothetical protein
MGVLVGVISLAFLTSATFRHSTIRPPRTSRIAAGSPETEVGAGA